MVHLVTVVSILAAGACVSAAPGHRVTRHINLPFAAGMHLETALGELSVGKAGDLSILGTNSYGPGCFSNHIGNSQSYGTENNFGVGNYNGQYNQYSGSGGLTLVPASAPIYYVSDTTYQVAPWPTL